MLASLLRIIALTRKELLAVLKDRRARLSLLIPPMVQALIFGYAATYDLNRVPYALLDQDHSAASVALVAGLDGSGAFERVANLRRVSDVPGIIDSRRALLVLRIDQDFEQRLFRQQPADLQVIADGRNSNTAGTAMGYISSIVDRFNVQWRHDHGLVASPLQLIERSWYNPNLETRWYMIPGMIGTLTLIQTMMLTVMSVAREREQGTFDQLLVTPFRPHEIMVGKALPSMIVGTIQATGVLLVAQIWFRIPFAGHYVVLYGGLLLFLLAAVGIGLLLSSIASTMQQAMLFSMVFIMPFSLLSGFTTPISSMPGILQQFTLINPLRFAIDIARRVYLEGAGFGLLLPDLWPLAVMAAVTLTAAAWAFRHGGNDMTPHQQIRHARLQRACAVTAAACSVVLTGCTVGPNFVRPTPPLPAHWSAPMLQPVLPAASAAPATAAAASPAPPVSTLEEQPASLTSWWLQFNDPTLSSLITRALQANLDLRVAVLRSQEALAQRDISAAGLWPNLSANASYERERISESTPEGSLLTSVGSFAIPGRGRISIPNPYNQYQLGGAASWEIDLFGHLRRSVEAANAAVQVSDEDQRAVQVSLLGQVAQSYVALRGAQARKAVAIDNIATVSDLLQLTRQRHDAGLNTDLDVRNASAQLSQTRASLPGLDLQISRSIHELSDLLGLAPEALRAELDQAAPIPPLPPQVPVGLPAQLARRRPDIREAEANLHEATAQIGVAVSDLFPRLTLSTAGGLQSETLGKLLNWNSLFGSAGPQLDIPVFDRGRWKSVRLYKVKAQEAALSYRSTVLNALQEVEDQAAAYRADQQQRQWLTDTVTQNGLALALARQRYASGVSDFLTVLDAQRTLQQNQLALLTSTAAVSSDLVSLYRALGGGWSDAPAQ